ncbi:hypothetical protein [Gimesia sp.]|uniref:hypothetical protein n=1 Tax=Gimesia sp. TaxID=2024833 RepID=UPI0032EBF7C5
MTNLEEITSIAAFLAATQWKWNQSSIEAILASMGWQQHDSLPYRDDYSRFKNFEASVYKEDHSPYQIEIDIEVYLDVDELDARQFENKIDEFKDKFFRTTEAIANSLGKPNFSDSFAASGFPDDQDAVYLTLWNLNTARLMLQLKNEGREIPIRLTLVVASISL